MRSVIEPKTTIRLALLWSVGAKRNIILSWPKSSVSFDEFVEKLKASQRSISQNVKLLHH